MKLPRGVLLAVAATSAVPAPCRSAEQRAPVAATPAPASRFVYAGQFTQGGWLRGEVPPTTLALQLDGSPVEYAYDGSFLVGFDRDAGPTVELAAQLADGRIIRESVVVAPRAWQIEHIGIPPRPGSPGDEEFRRRREAELARIAAARRLSTGALGWRQSFIWPARGRISGPFGSQRIYQGTAGAYHSGLDIAGGGGTTFVAPADGVVVLAAETPFTLEGRLLIIDHGHGLNSAFLHCSALLVSAGEQVRQGQPLGRIGMTGRATGPHLHWSMKWRETRLDPILFTGPMPG